MSERINQIMEKYDVDFEAALKIMERQNNATVFLHNYINPYGRQCH